MSDEFDFSELRSLQVALAEATPKVEALAKAAVAKAGHDTVAVAQQLVPVDTGFLKNSIRVDFDDDEFGFTAGATASYAGYVELGTSRMAPRPYLGPAFDRASEEFVRAIEQIGGQVLE